MNLYDTTRYNLCVLGDESVQGYGDQLQLGFIGRILKQELSGYNIVHYNLGRFGSTSLEIAKYLPDDISSRFTPDAQNRLIIVMPNRDIDVHNVARSRLSLANILDEVQYVNLRTLILGPTPRNLDDNSAIAELSASLEEVCTRRNASYIDLYSPLVNNQQWIQAMMASDGQYPDQIGYGLIAWILLHLGLKEFITN